MSINEIQHFLWSGISFIAFLLTCSGLLEWRFGRKENILVSIGFLIGIGAVQAGLLFSGQDQMLVLTLLPLTAYLPASIGVHILSKSGFFQTSAVWTAGIMVSYTLNFLQKILIQDLSFFSWQKSWIQTVCLLLAAALLLLIVYRYLRGPFRAYVLYNHTNWLLLSFPVAMVFTIFSYVENSTLNRTVLVLIFLTALSIFLVVARVLVSATSIHRMEEAEKAAAAQLEIQHREYEDICKKMELGRAYRHDMRHHLAVLEGLANKENNEEILRYIGGLGGQLSEISQEVYCENTTVNAVLSSCIGQAAKEQGCTVTSTVQIPREIPFDEMDICVILANALENAAHACGKIAAKEKRHVHITADFAENRKITISVVNPCDTKVAFDKDGFPIVPKREGHGIGLKSIDAIAKKYNGIFHCECKEGNFRLRVMLFDSMGTVPLAKKDSTPKKAVSATLMSILAFCFMVNCMPVVVQAMEGLPELGALVRVVNLRSYDFRWGDTAFHATLPQMKLTGDGNDSSSETQSSNTEPADTASSNTVHPTSEAPDVVAEESHEVTKPSGTILWESNGTTSTIPSLPEVIKPPETSSEPGFPPTNPEIDSSESPDISDGIKDINQQMEEYIGVMREKFLWYVARKYHGYVAMDITYDVIRNDDALLSVRFDTTINVGGSGQYSRNFTLDKRTGKVLELKDLFVDGSDYIGVVSEDILRQMTEQVNAELAIYFIPGSIWREDECFKEIDPDKNFYINDRNQLVIVFDEYEVAPGNAGMPEFILPTEKLDAIFRQPSPLNESREAR